MTARINIFCSLATLFLGLNFSAATPTNFILLDENGQEVVHQVEGLQGRDSLVIGLHRNLAHFLKNYTFQKVFSDIPQQEQDFLKEVYKVITKTPSELEFSDDGNYFNQLKGGKNRLMGTSSLAGDSIKIQNELLKNIEVDLASLLLLLVHEYGHKTTEPDWAVRDSAARKFSEYLKGFSVNKEISSSLKVETISLPPGKVDNFLKDVGPNGVQPTFVIFAKYKDHYTDLTSSIANEFAKQSSSYKNLFAELRRLMMHAMAPLADMMSTVVSQVMAPLAKAFGASDFDGGAEDLKEKVKQLNSGVGEVRLLDFFDITAIEHKDFVDFVFSTKFVVGHELREALPVNVNGWPFEKEQYLFLKLKATTKAQNDDRLVLNNLAVARSLEPAPEVKAEITEIDDGTSGKTIKVVLENVKDFEYAVLNIQAGNNNYYLYPSSGAINAQEQIDAARKQMQEQLGGFGAMFGGMIDEALKQLGEQIEQSGAVKEIFKNMNQVELYFEVPDWMEKSNQLMFADSLILNREYEVSLLKSYKINNGEAHYKDSQSRAQIVKGSFGIWGVKSAQPYFKNSFNYHEPIYNFFNIPSLNNSVFSIDAREAKFEFILDHPIDIHGILFSLAHQSFVLEAETEKIGIIPIEGEKVPFAEGGNLKDIKDFPQIYSVPPQHIKTTKLSNGQMKVEVLIRPGMKFVRGIAPEETGLGHGIPMIIFQSMELTARGGDMIYHNIGEPLQKSIFPENDEIKNCAQQLKDKLDK